MNFIQSLKEIGRGAAGARSLSAIEAEHLYAAILDGGVPDLELGAILIALRMKGESSEEMAGFLAALESRTYSLARPTTEIRPVVLPSYNGARKGANLTPLLALLLQRFGVPVLVHGLLEGFGRVTSAHVFRELGLMPAASLIEAQQQIDRQGLAFVPLPALSPGLSSQLLLRARLGLRNCAHSLVKMLDPFQSQGVLVAAATHPDYLDRMREVLQRRGQRALLLRATEGEPFANPLRRPRIELIEDDACRTLFEGEHESIKSLPYLPEAADARSTAQWTRRVLDDNLPLPLPLAHQLVCCLYASGFSRDFNEAKALVSVEAKAAVA
ncbi:MAG: DNA-binding protein YbiB [Zoogloeaceae bacterium]|jgi:anthranilate phosphoribosyltransferase|nr:DNA-binding protein YbiB [Zoogloeaceae bacterium]